ncbi:N-formylglutamate amidohydrolase [Lentibacter algarum]|uniref:N-formylglutamate amidohydrolase n=1 Tax=Lentibacter algarum TaxID=576131 RepID=UPI001C078CD1|nr:N-formylglutamate amidohydrolase [Lentibacter algarum]MBU2981472.1 N-formylglutamate amidohydrolase [Lentibacter algarum]
MSHTAFEIIGAERHSRWLITSDHATNAVPEAVNGGSLELPEADMQRHIAFDIGAKGLSEQLGEVMNAPVITSNFSRLVIDPNRGLEDPTLIMKLYDGTIIPANHPMSAEERQHRIDAYWQPYHDAYEGLAARREDTVVAAIHSFSPQLNGRPPRPWHIGVLHAGDCLLGPALVKRLQREDGLCVGDNQPYAGHLPGDAVDQHALKKHRANVLIELRSDLIETHAEQAAWAKRLGPILEDVLAETGL